MNLKRLQICRQFKLIVNVIQILRTYKKLRHQSSNSRQLLTSTKCWQNNYFLKATFISWLKYSILKVFFIIYFLFNARESHRSAFCLKYGNWVEDLLPTGKARSVVLITYFIPIAFPALQSAIISWERTAGMKRENKNLYCLLIQEFIRMSNIILICVSHLSFMYYMQNTYRGISPHKSRSRWNNSIKNILCIHV